MPIYQPGDTVRLSTEFRDPDTGALVDPTTVTLEVVNPAGVSTNYPSGAITRDGVGQYHVDHVTATAGLYRGRWIGTGAAAGVDEFDLMVQPSLLSAPLLCSVEDVRALLDTPTANKTHDDLTSTLIAQGSALIEKTAERELAPRGTLTRLFRAEDGLIDLNPYDLQSASLITLAAPDSPSTAQTLVLDTDYVLSPENAREGTYQAVELANTYRRYGSRFGFARASITGVWGMAAVPRSVELACAVMVATVLRRDVQTFSSTYSIDEGRLERPEELPSQVRATIERFARWGG